MVTMVVQNLKHFSNTFLICKILCDRHHCYYQASVVSLTCTFRTTLNNCTFEHGIISSTTYQQENTRQYSS